MHADAKLIYGMIKALHERRKLDGISLASWETESWPSWNDNPDREEGKLRFLLGFSDHSIPQEATLIVPIAVDLKYAYRAMLELERGQGVRALIPTETLREIFPDRTPVEQLIEATQ